MLISLRLVSFIVSLRLCLSLPVFIHRFLSVKLLSKIIVFPEEIARLAIEPFRVREDGFAIGENLAIDASYILPEHEINVQRCGELAHQGKEAQFPSGLFHEQTEFYITMKFPIEESYVYKLIESDGAYSEAGYYTDEGEFVSTPNQEDYFNYLETVARKEGKTLETILKDRNITFHKKQ